MANPVPPTRRILWLGIVLLNLVWLASCNSASSNTGNGSGSTGTGTGGGNNGGTGGNAGCSQMTTGTSASLGGFVPFASSSLWNTDISGMAVDPNSDSMINNWVGASTHMHPDWGTDPTYGIPYVVVSGKQSLVDVNLGAYPDESDPGPMPVPANAPMEGGSGSTGDRHVLVLDNGNCFLYELYNSSVNGDGRWNADSTAVWDLLGDEQRPYTWTSADAAGLPILPGLVKYDEAASGTISHAFRFTLPHTRAAFIPPASHWAGNTSDSSAPPMGMRLRLKASYDISSYSTQMQTILKAMQKYGLILADNGSSLYVTGASDSRWGSDLESLKNVPATAFEVVAMNPVYTSANVPTGNPPSISAFTATPAHVAAGGAVTLSWTASGSSYVIVSPGAGVVRGTSTTVNPSTATTYTLIATNAFGRTTATVSVAVP